MVVAPFLAAEKPAHPRKTRVGVFGRCPANRIGKNAAQVTGARRVASPTGTKSASGRAYFLNSDPIQEAGGLNLYGFCGNDGVNRFDVLGQDQYDPPDVWENHDTSGRAKVGVVSKGGSSGGDFGVGTDLATGSGTFRAGGGGGAVRKTDSGGINNRQSDASAIARDLATIAAIERALANGLSVTVQGADGKTVTLIPGGTSSYSFGGATLNFFNSAPNNTVPGINTTTARITPGSGLGNILRHIPLLGGLLGGAGDIVSGAFNTTAGIVTFGQSGTFGRGIGQIAGGTGEIIGRAWSAPNTAIGLAFGGVGMLFGATPHWDSNAAILRFTGMPNALMPTAMSMGSVNVFGRNSPPNSDNNVGVGVSTGREESLHTVQSRMLGPLYFPAHILGGMISIFTPDQKSWNPGFDSWHRNNFMEQGPMHGSVF